MRARSVVLHPHAERSLADFARVRRADRGHRIGKFYSGFQGVDHAARQIVGIQPRLGVAQPQIGSARGRNDALIADVMNRQHRPRAREQQRIGE